MNSLKNVIDYLAPDTLELLGLAIREARKAVIIQSNREFENRDLNDNRSDVAIDDFDNAIDELSSLLVLIEKELRSNCGKRIV